MTTAVAPVVAAWQTFQADTHNTLALRPPENEAEYDALVAFADELTSRYNCNEGPQAALFDLVAAFISGWEERHYADVRDAAVPPHVMLAHYMDGQGLSQSQLAKEIETPQQNLSEVLRGSRGISVALARKLAARFNVRIEMFI